MLDRSMGGRHSSKQRIATLSAKDHEGLGEIEELSSSGVCIMWEKVCSVVWGRWGKMNSCSGWLREWGWEVRSSAWSLPDTGVDYNCSLGVCCVGWREAMVGASFKRGNKRPWDRPQRYSGLWKDALKWTRQWVTVMPRIWTVGCGERLPRTLKIEWDWQLGR